MIKIVACSKCFSDYGLYLMADEIGQNIDLQCPNCNSKNGKKLSLELLGELAYCFFVNGSLVKCKYGGYPKIQYNKHSGTSINLDENLNRDMSLFKEKLDYRFFEYGPRAWMYGEITPLKELQDKRQRKSIIARVVNEYPEIMITKKDNSFYKIRNAKHIKYLSEEFDSPPKELLGNGRFDCKDQPILYASQDLELCLHEIRAKIEDDLYVATLIPNDVLRCLDLTVILKEKDNVSEFESLDLALYFLFLASDNAYEITREIGKEARRAGYDGIVYPSYFSSIRNGAIPYQALVFGIANRIIPDFEDFENSKISKNIALFGRPIKEGKVVVKNINKLVINNIKYKYSFGPVLEDM